MMDHAEIGFEAIRRALEYFGCGRIPGKKPVQKDSYEIVHQLLGGPEYRSPDHLSFITKLCSFHQNHDFPLRSSLHQVVTRIIKIFSGYIDEFH